jgi:hypothetical protein
MPVRNHYKDLEVGVEWEVKDVNQQAEAWGYTTGNDQCSGNDVTKNVLATMWLGKQVTKSFQ